jgi:hypothetical protein
MASKLLATFRAEIPLPIACAKAPPGHALNERQPGSYLSGRSWQLSVATVAHPRHSQELALPGVGLAWMAVDRPGRLPPWSFSRPWMREEHRCPRWHAFTSCQAPPFWCWGPCISSSSSHYIWGGGRMPWLRFCWVFFRHLQRHALQIILGFVVVIFWRGWGDYLGVPILCGDIVNVIDNI